jgi:hypothetical protein
MSRELTPKAPAARPKRTSTTVRNRLSIQNKDPNFVYRVVNDRDDRVEILKEIGYEVCTRDELKIGDKRVDLGAPIGSAATLALGGGDKGVVMKIPKEWYDADQLAKHDAVSRSEQTMKEDARKDGNYGKIEISRG